MSQHRIPNFWRNLPIIERIYPLIEPAGFEAVDNAVCNVIDRLMPGYSVRRVVKDGLVVYNPVIIGPYETRLAVVRIGPLTTEVEFELLMVRPPFPDDLVITEDVLKTNNLFFRDLDQAVVRVLRAEFHAAGVNPPMPPSEDLTSVLVWHYIYHPNMSNEELAELSGLASQSIANARSRYGLSRNMMYEGMSWEELSKRYSPEKLEKYAQHYGKVRR